MRDASCITHGKHHTAHLSIFWDCLESMRLHICTRQVVVRRSHKQWANSGEEERKITSVHSKSNWLMWHSKPQLPHGHATRWNRHRLHFRASSHQLCSLNPGTVCYLGLRCACTCRGLEPVFHQTRLTTPMCSLSLDGKKRRFWLHLFLWKGLVLKHGAPGFPWEMLHILLDYHLSLRVIGALFFLPFLIKNMVI